MRIVVNDIAASKGGAMSILKDFYKYIKEHDKDNEWIFLLGDRYIDETDHIKVITLPEVKKSRIKKLLFDFVYGHKVIDKLKPDAVFSLQNIITFGVNAKQVVYVHQSLPFQREKKFSLMKREERNLAIYQKIIGEIIKFSIKKADKVIVQTKWMKRAVCEKTGIDESKITNILPEIEDIEYSNQEIDNRRFFYPSADALYKNNECIYKANEILMKDGYKDYKIKITIDKKEKYKNIEFTGRMPREDVIKEYAKSVLIFPSYIETFGYPLAEARGVGTVILASDCEFSGEVLEGYENAYFFDPFKPDELVKLMKDVMDKRVEKYSSHSIQSEQISWGKITKEVLSL